MRIHGRQSFVGNTSHSIKQLINRVVKLKNRTFFSYGFDDSALLAQLISSIGMLSILNLKKKS
jgi:hypothetical protein